jgi:hypothetical protein
MDWIEQLFGLSPDGGDGSIEALIAFVFTLALAVTIWRVPELRGYIAKVFANKGGWLRPHE